MRRFLISSTLLLAALAVPRAALPQDVTPSDTSTDSSDSSSLTDSSGVSADSSDLFLNAYMANEAGEKLENSGDATRALQKYRYAASLLDQISRNDPKWQPIVVDYRKKRVSDNIARLQQQMGQQPAPAPDANTVPLDDGMPTKEETLPGTTATETPSVSTAGLSDQAKAEIEELQSDLRDSQRKLKSVEVDKQSLATRLNDALKQLDQTKVDEAELKGELQKTQDAYQTALADHTPGGNGLQKQYQQRISQLEDALKDAEADRDAADEENADYARRATKARQNTATIAQARDAALAKNKDLQAKFADASKLADQLDAANKQIAALTKSRNDATQHASDLEQQLADTSKSAERLVAAEKQIAALKTSATQSAAQNAAETAALDSKLSDARKQIAQLKSDRDTAKQQITDLNAKLTDAQTTIASVKADRDQIAAQRDQAVAELDKARAAEKRVNELLADNSSLTKKLAADDDIIKNFKSNSPDRDKQIAQLQKEVTDTKALLADAEQQKDSVQSTLNDLQQQYDSTSAELTELKANNQIASSEKKTLTDENDLLRNIVVRQLKAQAERDQVKRLVMDQLSQLSVTSDTLLKRIAYLGQPVVILTDKEKALFKDPTLDIPDADDSSMDIQIAAPKQQVSSAPDALDPKPAILNATAPPSSNVVSNATPSAAQDDPVAPAPTLPAATPSATPTNLASQSAPVTEQSILNSTPSTSGATPSPVQQTGFNSSSGSSAGPMVPPALMDDAKDAKDAFEREDYRAAEKIYERMLTAAPTNVYILSNLGVVYFRNQKWQLAEESLKKAIAVAPEDTFSWCTLGIVYYQEKRYDDAINALTRALAINPRYAVAHNYLGITASQKGWQEAALKELQTAVEYDPSYGDAYFNLAVVYAMQQPPNKELARKNYKRATDLGAAPDPGLDEMLK
jgi:tetratricopeptide (TPR) repeat protein